MACIEISSIYKPFKEDKFSESNVEQKPLIAMLMLMALQTICISDYVYKRKMNETIYSLTNHLNGCTEIEKTFVLLE